MSLSLVAGWFHVDVCAAEEVNQSIPQPPPKRDEHPSLEVFVEQNTETTQDEMKDEKSQAENQISDILKDYVLPAVLLPLVPVAIGMQVICLFVVRDFSRCVGH